MKQRKRDYKVVQLGFKYKPEYESFHNEAKKNFPETKNPDCIYLRYCIGQTKKKRINATDRDKVKSLVMSQQRINEMMQVKSSEEEILNLKELEREMLKQWVI